MRDCLAEKVGWPLRGADGGFAAARLEQGSKAHTHSARKQKGPARGPFCFLAVERVLRGGYFADFASAEAGR